jgi:hypothetical protein
VGALFFTILMIASFSVLSLALDAQTDIVTTQRIVSDIEIKKQQEQFGVSAYTYGGNLLNVTVSNQGQNPVEISSIWIVNKTLSDEPATRYAVTYDDAFVPSGLVSNVLFHQALAMTPDTYDIKVISALGSIKTIDFNTSAGPSNGLRAELITDAPDVIIGQNVTVAMIVTNSGFEYIQNVKPEPLSVGGTGSVIASTPHTPSSVNLNRGESVMFSWDYQVTGNSGDDLTFSTFAKGDYESPGDVSSNVASDVSILRLPTDGGPGGVPDIVNDDLFARPQLFFIIPSSQGESGDTEALWGMNIINPINAPMQISKVIITAFAPGGNNNDRLFFKGGGPGAPCNFNPVSPVLGPDSNWSCPSENALMWKSSTPIIIPANSTASFLTKVRPGSPSANSGLESIIVQGSVFTTSGSFGKSGYQSTMSEDPNSIVNVYLTDDILNPRVSGDIQTIRTGIPSNSLETFSVALADMDLDDGTWINPGAQLIINVPKQWTDVDVIAWSHFDGEPEITPFGDGSHQIVGITSDPYGDAIYDAGTITFEARAPVVGEDQLYVMYILAQGITENGFSIGPLAEIILQVDG